MTRYIEAKTFKDFCLNQEQLIQILNHRMTGIETAMISIKTDVCWLKRLLWIIIGLVGTIVSAVLIKSIGG